MWVAVVLTVWSGIDYFVKSWQYIAEVYYHGASSEAPYLWCKIKVQAQTVFLKCVVIHMFSSEVLSEAQSCFRGS